MPATDMPIAGINTYFGLGTGAAPATATDVSEYLDGVEPTKDTDELDGTTFRKPSKVIIPGFKTISYSLSGKWSRDAHTHFRGIEGKTGVAYEYGPEGNTTASVKITGVCSVLSYSGPVAGVDSITTFTVELRVDTETDGVYP
jgi:hypothetical protein